MSLHQIYEDDTGNRLNPSKGMAGKYPKRANWRDKGLVLYFIELCLEEVRSRNTNGDALWRVSRYNIQKRLLVTKGVKCSQIQLKNQWYLLKKKYKVWTDLIEFADPLDMDPITNSVPWSDKEWSDYLKQNPDANQFRFAKLEFAVEMSELFDDGVMTVDRAKWSTSSEESDTKSVGSSSSSHLVIKIKPPQKNISLDYYEFSSDSSSSSLDASLPKDKRGKKRKSNDFHGPLERSDGPTLKECNQILDGMKKLDMDNPLYVVACSMFCESRAYREQWMILFKKPEAVRISWIQMYAKKYGAL